VVDVKHARATGWLGRRLRLSSSRCRALDGIRRDRDGRAPARGCSTTRVGMMGHLLRPASASCFTRADEPAEPGPPSLAAVGESTRPRRRSNPRRHLSTHRPSRVALGAGERVHDAMPAVRPTGGQPWAYKRVQGRPTRPARTTRCCTAEAVDLMAKIRANDHLRAPRWPTPLSPITFVNKIKVPTFMALAQFHRRAEPAATCPTLAEHLNPGTKPQVGSRSPTALTSTSLDPGDVSNRWYDFFGALRGQTRPR